MARREPGAAAVLRRSPASQLTAFTRGEPDERRPWLSLDELIRDRMPPLEDLIIGGQPSPLGPASAVAVIMGGLFMLYRGIIDLRVPLLMILTAYVVLLILPVPVVVSAQGPHWRWVAAQEPGVGWSLGITMANYELLAGPMLFVAFYLATAPGVSPMSRRARAVYALLLGTLAAVFQLYLSVQYGAYLALIAAGLLSAWIDRVFRPRPLV
jgi:Na+-translocating ferredoxin:NAD+ oxidoreductase RnfD subunit